MTGLCIKCGYSVTEPLCAYCVTQEIKTWLYEQPLEDKTMKAIITKLKQELNEIESLDFVFLPSRRGFEESIMKCLKCKRKMRAHCSYCITNQAGRILKDKTKSCKVRNSFNQSFNIGYYNDELKNYS